ncbi:Bug family tripartite tricarboxylate transporter substrate binding protein [Cupriavidus pauculus]|uniref:Bug family tripartite tricarboxylate transporter substrate binding protein n=1 Tax=Cupriavidus pauculus TaxID=82633 RepID=UPI001FD07B72|nr:tripartite tricarboxylate transporter substrate binding protein [Cupriavidus pauculus]
MKTRLLVAQAFAIATFCPFSNPSTAAPADWPQRPVRVIVPFSSGSGLDVLARAFAEQLATQTHQTFVVENRDGAGGGIGSVAVARSAPDGYTLLFTAHSPFASAPYIKDGPTYDPVKDFTPITKVAQTPMLLVSAASGALKSFDEVIRYVKANPGKLSYASSGVGTPSHLHMEVVKQTVGLDIQAVPYKSTGQAMTDLIGGQVALYMPSYPAALPQLRAGQIRALAIGSATRSPEFPNVPTLAEALRRPQLRASVWYGYLGPKGMPGEVVSRIDIEVSKAAQSPRVRQLMKTIGSDPDIVGPVNFGKQIATDAKDSQELLGRLGIARGVQDGQRN